MAKALPKKVSGDSPLSKTNFGQTKHFNEWLVFLAAFVLFAYTIGSQYNMDDELVTNNHRLTSKGIAAIPEIFSSPYYQDESGYSYEYRPLVLTSFAIEHQFFGDNAHVSHFFNIIFYSLCCLVLLKTLLKLFKNYSPLLSLAITLLFIVHPAHTEVVCSIKNRDEILGLLFGLLTLLVAVKAIEAPRKWWLVLVPVLFAMALMGKITVICFVLIIPLALVLFTEAGLGWILLTAALLIVPSFILMNLNSGWDKIWLFIGVLGITVAFYSIINFQEFRQAVKKGTKYITGTLFGDGLQDNKQGANETDNFNVKNLLKKIRPDKSLLSPVPAIIAIVLGASYLFCVARMHSSMALIPIVILMLLAWKGEEKISWWSSVIIGVCMLGSVLVSNAVTNDFAIHLYGRMVGMYLVIQLCYGKRNLFIPTLLLYILFNTIGYRVFDNFNVFFFLLVILLNNKYLVIVYFLLFTVTGINLESFKTSVDFKYILSNSIDVLILICIFFKFRIRTLPWVLLILVLAWFHYNRVGMDRQIQVEKTVTALRHASDDINPKVVATPENRPLSYIEDCVDLSTPVAIRMGTSLQILYHYLCKVILPYPLSFYYGSNYIHPQKITEALPLVTLTLYLLLLAVAMFFLKTEPLISFGLFVYLISTAVFSNYLQPVPGMFADRFLLIPSLGWIIVLLVVIQKIWRADMGAKIISLPAVPKYARYTFCVILVTYGCMAFARSLDWHDDLKLMRHDVKVVPESIQAHNLLGIHLVRASFVTPDPGEQKALREEALGHLKTAHSLFPAYFNFSYDVGRTYNLLNMPDSAMVYFKEAYVINPDFPDVPLNLANISFLRNDFQGAIPYYIKLVNMGRADFTTYDKLSYAYFKTNQLALSIKTNEEAIKLFPSQVDPYINIATCYLNSSSNGRDSAIVWLNRALALSPNNPSVINYLKKLGN